MIVCKYITSYHGELVRSSVDLIHVGYAMLLVVSTTVYATDIVILITSREVRPQVLGPMSHVMMDTARDRER